MTNNDEDLLSELLLQWEELYERGQDTPADQLCGINSALVDELSQRIAALKATNWLNDPNPNPIEDPSSNTQANGSRSSQVLMNRYRLDHLIAEGGFAEVWRAYDKELQRIVAVKIPKPSRLESTDSFLAEARRVARLKHPGIVPVHDVGVENGNCFIVSEYVEGGSLGDQLARFRPAPEQVVRWITEIADALEYAHLHGVIHRDIKPANILIDHHGRALLADFGIAQSANKTGSFDPSLGTLRYMAPEQLEGLSATPASDVFSLGLVLHEALVGKLPYSSDSPSVVRREIGQGLHKAVSQAIPGRLRPVCAKALNREPQKRHTSAAHFAASLREAEHHKGRTDRVLRLIRLILWTVGPLFVLAAFLLTARHLLPRPALPKKTLPAWDTNTNSTSTTLAGIASISRAYTPVLHTACPSPKDYLQQGGGAVAPNGKVYCMPSPSGRILTIDPVTKTATSFSAPVTADDAAFFGAVLAPDKSIYCIPHNSTMFLRIDPEKDTAHTFGEAPGRGAFWGGILAPNGCIYCVPSCASHAMELDPRTQSTKILGDLSSQHYKYSGGVLAPNGSIYCMPDNANRILKIEPESGSLSFIGPEIPGEHGKAFGGVLAPNGKIYSGPAHSSRIIVIDPTNDSLTYIPDIPQDRYRGSVLGPDGAIYMIPADGSPFLILNPNDHSVTTLNNRATTKGSWGAVLTPHGVVVGIPWSATDIMFLDFGVLVPDNWALGRAFNHL